MQMLKRVSISWSPSRLRSKLLAVAFVPFLLTSLCIAVAVKALSDAQVEEQAEHEVRQIVSDCETMRDSLMVCATLSSIYSHAHNPQILEEINRNRNALQQARERLIKNLSGSPEPMATILQELQNVSDQSDGVQKDLIADLSKDDRGVGSLKIISFYNELGTLAARRNQLLAAIERQAEGTTVHSQARSGWARIIRQPLSLEIALSVFASIGVGLLLSRRIVERLKDLSDKAARLSRLEPPGSAARGSDEIAELDRVFNDMADSLLSAVKMEQAAIASAADLIFCVDASGAVISVNAGALMKYGWESADVLGAPVLKFMNISSHDAMNNALHGETSCELEAGFIQAGGRECASIWSVSWSAGRHSAIAIVHDISDRKTAEDELAASEAQVRLIMERMPAGLLIVERDGRIRFANSTARFILGDADNLIGRRFVDLVTDDEHQAPDLFMQLMIQRAHPCVVRLKNSIAPNRRVKLHLNEFDTRSGTDLFSMILLDYTEHAQLEELKQRLVAMMAHDIATPLSTVHSTVSMIAPRLNMGQDTALSPLIMASEKIGGILELFNNVVRFQNMAAGFSVLEAAKLPLSVLTTEALNVVAQRLNGNGAGIINEVPAEPIAIGDATRLAVLAATLLQLAVESFDGQRTIRIGGFSSDRHAVWTLLVDETLPTNARLRTYIAQGELSVETAESEALDLDLVMWTMLLYQCGAKVTLTDSDNTCEIQLKLPSLQEIGVGTLAA